MTEKPILYSFRRCPYAMRARLALLASGQAVELREVVLRDKPAAMLEASPKGTVPVLVLADGNIIEESRDVMAWALEKGDPEGWLEGDADLASRLIDACDGDFKHHLDRYKYASRYEGAVSEEHRAAAEGFLRELEGRLRAHAWLLGEAPSIADYAIFPFIRQFANTDKAWFDTAPYPSLRAWLEKLVTSEKFLAVMKKYPQWRLGDPAIFFPA